VEASEVLKSVQLFHYVSVVLHRCDILCYLKEVIKMERICERDLRGLLEPKRNDVTVGGRKLQNEELRDL
jgi:hypothetical protein